MAYTTEMITTTFGFLALLAFLFLLSVAKKRRIVYKLQNIESEIMLEKGLQFIKEAAVKTGKSGSGNWGIWLLLFLLLPLWVHSWKMQLCLLLKINGPEGSTSRSNDSDYTS